MFFYRNKIKFNISLIKKIEIIFILFLFLFSGLNKAQAAISYGNAGTIAYSSQNGSSVSPAYPTSITSGNLLVLIIGMKPSTANSGSVTTPSGWTPIISLSGAGGYSTTLGADSGNTNIFGYYKIASGTESGSLAVSLTTNNVSWAQILRFSNTTGYWNISGATGSDTASGSVSILFSSNPGVTSGDHIIGAMTIPTDVTTPSQFSGESFSQSGAVFGPTTEISEPDSGTGSDIGGFIVRSYITSGTATVNPTMTASAGGTTTNVRGPGIFIRLREPAVSLPTVTTQAVSDIKPTEANGNGNATSDGNGVITERGFVWNTSINPTTSDSKVVVSGTTGAYTGSITGLTQNTLYYVRAYAINSAGTSYGDNVTFTSQASPSVVLNTTNGYAFAGDSTPTLEMTATDPTGEDVNYNIQIHTSNQFLDRWVSVGLGDSHSILYSEDAINWTGSNDSKTIFTEGKGVAWNGNMFVATGSGPNTLAYSYDGINWTGLGTSIFSSVGEEVSWNGTMWVAFGGGTANDIAYSYDGINWVGAGKVFGTKAFSGSWNGTMWVSMGYGPHSIAYSYDGINWTGITGKTIFNGGGRDVFWGDNKFVAVGNGTNNTLAYSYDGINWTPLGISIFGDGDNKGMGDGITYGNGMFVAVGYNGPNSLAYSYNGIDWTGLGTTYFSGSYGVDWNGHMFVIGSSGNDSLYYSSDGINWTGTTLETLFSSWGNNATSTTPVGYIPSIDFLDKVSDTDSGFINTISGGDNAPFNSSQKVSYTIQSGNELAPGTYYWRVRSKDPNGSNTYGSWSEVRSFTVGVMLPTLDTVSVLSTGTTTASAAANITNMGGVVNDKRGFVYDVASRSNPGNVAPASTFYSNMIEETGSFGPGNFTMNISGLTQGIQYYFRSYSHNNIGYSYGDEVILQFAPSVVLNTTDAINIADLTPTLQMTATDINNDDLNYQIQIQEDPVFLDRWVAVGDGADSISYSDDSLNWTGVTGKTIFSGYGRGVVWNGEKFVALGNGTNAMAYSSDGINWTGLGTSIFTDGHFVAWNGTMWVAVGDGTSHTMAYSSDGINWTGLGKSIFSVNGEGIAWNGTMWVAVGSGTANTMAYSYNGTDWTGLGKDIFNTSGESVAWNGTMWVATGEGTNSIAYSSDGINWTGVTGKTIFSVNGESIVWGNGTWVVVGDGSNTIAYSLDGINWTGVTGKTIFSNYGYGISWDGEKFIAVGSGTNSMAYSYNGINWTGLGKSSFSTDGEGIASSTPLSMVPSIPVISKKSETDAGFLNTVSTGDLQPFSQGNKVSYTVQTGNELTIGETYYWRARAIDSNGSNTYSDWSEVRSFTVIQPAIGFTQSSYRFFGNNDDSVVFLALATQDTPASLSSNKNEFRLRSLIHFGNDVPTDGQEFKLQYAEKIGECDNFFTGENYIDVVYNSEMAYSDNFKPEDGVSLVSSPDDPVHDGHTVINQTYVESNNFTNSVSGVNAGQDSKWDFALRYRGVYSSKPYCFRIVKADGSLLDSYLHIPEIVTTVYRSRGGGVGNIENSTTPNSPVGGGGQGGGSGVILAQCNDGIDNDSDTLIDSNDPNCHIDGNINNPYMKGYNSEATPAIINTGGDQGGGSAGDLGYILKRKSLSLAFTPYNFIKNLVQNLLLSKKII